MKEQTSKQNQFNQASVLPKQMQTALNKANKKSISNIVPVKQNTPAAKNKPNTGL